MFKKAKFVFISVICLLISVISASAQDSDTYTIVTYYPSPYGVYNELRLYPHHPSPTCDSTHEGNMYYDDDRPQPHSLRVCACTDPTPVGCNTYGWVDLGGAGGGGWSLTGNAGTIAGTNFIGTTDAVDWVVKTNNAERIRITSGGNVGIGTTSPSSGSGGQLKLDVEGPVGATKYCDKDGNNCRTNVQQVLTGTACSSSQAIRVINPDGTFSCVNLPPSAICTWGSKTYATGADCCWNSGGCIGNGCRYHCTANGSWDNTHEGCFGSICGQ